MSECFYDCDDPLMQIENGEEPPNDGECEQSAYQSETISTDCDGWLRENLVGSISQLEEQLQPEELSYLNQETLNLIDYTPPPVSWSSAGTTETISSEHDLSDQSGSSSQLSALVAQSNYRDFWWTSWPEYLPSAAGQSDISEAQIQSDLAMRQLVEDNSLGYTPPQHTAETSCGQIPYEEDIFNMGTDHFVHNHIHEPVPSTSSRTSLLHDWIEEPSQDQEFFADTTQTDEYQDWIAYEGSATQRYSSAFFTPICSQSPLETLSLPDLSCFRRQTPGTGGPSDSTSTERPKTPLGSSGKWVNTGYAHNENHSVAFPHHPYNDHFSSGSSNQRPTFNAHIFSRGEYEESHYDMARHQSIPPSQLPHAYFPNLFPAISIPSPPQMFSSTPISRVSSIVAVKNPVLLPPITDADLKPPKKDTEEFLDQAQSTSSSKHSPSRSKSDKLKRKRMHVCNTCGKDFNRPSALLLHATVHTGERSNFCNVCGKSFSNLSNLRRHQRQLHVLESEMPLPEIPGPTSALDAYNFGSQTRF